MLDGNWQLINAAAAPEAANHFDSNADEMKAEIKRLTQLTNDLQKQNHRLQFKNQILIAMCTISGNAMLQMIHFKEVKMNSEGDRQVAELQNQQLLKSNSFVKPQQP